MALVNRNQFTLADDVPLDGLEELGLRPAGAERADDRLQPIELGDRFLSGVEHRRVGQPVLVTGGFVAQAGGYTADLALKETKGTVVNESGNGLSNLRGSVGFARTNEPHSATSQFYINLADNLDLNPRPTRWGYAVFGSIVEGMEVVDEIGHVATGAGGPFDRSVPVEPIVIERVERLR